MKQVLAYPSWDQIHLGCAAIATQAAAHAPFEAVMGLSRGGLIPGVIISHLMGIPMITVDYSSTKGEGDNKGKTNILPPLPEDVNNILVVDDICDSGHTMNEVIAYYNKTMVDDFVELDSAALYHKMGSVHIPDFSWQSIPVDAPWIIFPWEM